MAKDVEIKMKCRGKFKSINTDKQLTSKWVQNRGTLERGNVQVNQYMHLIQF